MTQKPCQNRGKSVLIIQNLGEFPLASFQEAGLGNLAQQLLSWYWMVGEGVGGGVTVVIQSALIS